MKRSKSTAADLNKTSGPSPTPSLLDALLAAPTPALADLNSFTPVAEMPAVDPWTAIQALQAQWSQPHKFAGALLNSLFTERRIVFPLSRPGFVKLIRHPGLLGHGDISGTDFKNFRNFLLNNGYVRELRAPVERLMPGLYVLAHPALQPHIDTLLNGETMAKVELRAATEWDAQLKWQSTKESRKESTEESTSSNPNQANQNQAESAPVGRAASSSSTSSFHQGGKVQGDGTSSRPLVQAGDRPSLDQILLNVLAKKMAKRTRQERLAFVKVLAGEVQAAGYQQADVPDEFKARLVAKLVPTTKPKPMSAENYESWCEDVRADVDAAFSPAAQQSSNESPADDSEGARRTAAGTDIWSMLETAHDALENPMGLYGPFHVYKKKMTRTAFEKKQAIIVDAQMAHAAKHAAQSIRSVWSALTPAERAEHHWLRPGRDDAEIVAEFKAGTWRPAA